MKILVINAGSSSLKYQLIDMDGEKVMAKGNCERTVSYTHLDVYKRQSLIRQFCDKTIWLHNGRLQEYGEASEVCEHYKVFVEDVTSLEAEQKARIFSKWEKKRTR